MDENQELLEKFKAIGRITYRVARFQRQSGYYFQDLAEAAATAKEWSKKYYDEYPHDGLDASIYTVEIAHPEHREIIGLYRAGEQLITEDNREYHVYVKSVKWNPNPQ